ncbi:hypothetical protein ASE37_17090 [Rhizobium sp. Root268]|nr:hypothetical protein ASC86_17175 [Rhizobium sp. Root1212]KRD22442.1 hypothetical protein ASE37_17090 [Rhizobium sp. Root268]
MLLSFTVCIDPGTNTMVQAGMVANCTSHMRQICEVKRGMSKGLSDAGCAPIRVSPCIFTSLRDTAPPGVWNGHGIRFVKKD